MEATLNLGRTGGTNLALTEEQVMLTCSILDSKLKEECILCGSNSSRKAWALTLTGQTKLSTILSRCSASPVIHLNTLCHLHRVLSVQPEDHRDRRDQVHTDLNSKQVVQRMDHPLSGVAVALVVVDHVHRRRSSRPCCERRLVCTNLILPEPSL